MKVILLQDVAKIGRRFDIKNVSDGYARNFLLPRKLAEIATPKAVKKLEAKKAETATMEEVDKDILEKNIETLAGQRIEIEEKANEKGHLFSGVHKDEISKIIKEQKGLDIPAESIDLEQPIKEIGEHQIKIGNKEFTLEVKRLG